MTQSTHLFNELLDDMADEFADLDLSPPSPTPQTHQWTVNEQAVGQRLDKFLASQFGDLSRSFLQKQIDDGNVTVNGQSAKAKHTLKLDERIIATIVQNDHSDDLPENIALDIIYQDDSVLVINKPAGLVVHKGAGNWTGTLVNGLLYHFPNQSHLPRAGLVHRIDKDTTGLLVVAKTVAAQLHLTEQLKEKSVYRHYQCLVWGDLPSLVRHKVIDLPIARHQKERTKMAVRQNGKTAVTHLLNITPLTETISLVDIGLQTGRTHQIRVHLSHLGFPLLGDKVYGKANFAKKGLTDTQIFAIQAFDRQALHAYQLGFAHPDDGRTMTFMAPLPDDMANIIKILNDN